MTEEQWGRGAEEKRRQGDKEPAGIETEKRGGREQRSEGAEGQKDENGRSGLWCYGSGLRMEMPSICSPCRKSSVRVVLALRFRVAETCDLLLTLMQLAT